jgi:DNA transposition AAA+ family ATPase
MSQEADRVASILGDLPKITPEVQQELDRLNKTPYFPLPRVKSCHAFLEECRLGHTCARIIGDSGVGKTVAIKAYVERLSHIIKRETIVYVLLPRKCTPKVFYEEILKALGFRYSKGTTSALRNRALQILSKRQVCFLLFDEANHLNEDALGELHYLKELKVIQSIVLIGTSRLDTHIRPLAKSKVCYFSGLSQPLL